MTREIRTDHPPQVGDIIGGDIDLVVLKWRWLHNMDTMQMLLSVDTSHGPVNDVAETLAFLGFEDFGYEFGL